MTELTHITNHEAQALRTLLSQWADSPKIKALVRVFAARMQTLEDDAWALFVERGVETAEGVQLDILGEIVGQARLGLEDGDFRRLIRVRILANRACGRADVIAQVISGVLECEVKLHDPVYAGDTGTYRLTWETDDEPSEALLAQVRRLLDEISPVGVAWEAVDTRVTSAFRFGGIASSGFGEGGFSRGL